MLDLKRINKYTWENYKSYFTDIANSNIKFLYRGHSDERWNLVSTFHREAPKSDIDLNYYITSILPDVHHYISDIINEDFDFLNKNHLEIFLSMIQHHGFPTPLLDWTFSPYIGAYFAFREVDEVSPTSDYVKVFIFNYELYKHNFSQPTDILQPEPFISVIRPVARHNPRIIPQDCAFTITNVKDMGDQIRKLEDESQKLFLAEITMSVKEKVVALRDLDFMGINEQSLFPGLDGRCRSLKKRYFTAPEVGKTQSEILKELTEQLFPKKP